MRIAAPRTAIGLWCLIALSALGCRSNPNEVLLERDLRMQEDRIWHLQGMLEDCCTAREAMEHENESLRRQLSDPSHPAPNTNRAPARPNREPVRPRRNDGPVLQEPSVELPDISSGPAIELNPSDETGSVRSGLPTQLIINRRLTGGLDRDSVDGDEGILVVIELRDASGNLVKAPGTLSLVVMDPTQPGSLARVARWDFTADEVPHHFRNTVFGQGLQFELPWPNEPPKNRDLQLHVRFTTSEGQRLNSDAKLDIRTPSEVLTLDRQTQSGQRREAPTRTKPSPTSRLKSSDGQRSPRTPSAADQRNADGDRQAERPVWRPYR